MGMVKPLFKGAQPCKIQQIQPYHLFVPEKVANVTNQPRTQLPRMEHTQQNPILNQDKCFTVMVANIDSQKLDIPIFLESMAVLKNMSRRQS